MAAHASQSSLYLTLLQSSDMATAAVVESTQAMLKGQTDTNPFSVPAEESFLYLVYSGMTSTTGVFVPKESYLEVVVANMLLRLRNPLSSAATAYFGACAASSFTVPDCRSFIIKNNQSDAIYLRKGTANASGIPIAKPGDSNGDDVQGIRIEPDGSYTAQPGGFRPGDKYYLLGSGASQTATVHFL